jgi:hypothetical protein
LSIAKPLAIFAVIVPFAASAFVRDRIIDLLEELSFG